MFDPRFPKRSQAYLEAVDSMQRILNYPDLAALLDERLTLFFANELGGDDFEHSLVALRETADLRFEESREENARLDDGDVAYDLGREGGAA